MRNSRAASPPMLHSWFLSQGGQTQAGRDLEERDMGVFNGMFPIQAGKEEEARAFAARVLDVTGVDLAAPPEGPPPVVLFDWQA
jgi:hypothetical protein